MPNRKRPRSWHAGNNRARSFDFRQMSFRIKASVQTGACQRPDRRQAGSHHRQRGERLDKVKPAVRTRQVLPVATTSTPPVSQLTRIS